MCVCVCVYYIASAAPATSLSLNWQALKMLETWQAAKKDQYGRVLGVCFDEKTGVELNEKMVKEGEAIAYVAYSKVLHSTLLLHSVSFSSVLKKPSTSHEGVCTSVTGIFR